MDYKFPEISFDLDFDFLRDKVGDVNLIDAISVFSQALRKGLKQEPSPIFTFLLREVTGKTDPFVKYADPSIVDGKVYHDAFKHLTNETRRLMGENPFGSPLEEIKGCMSDINTLKSKAFENTLYVKDLLQDLKRRFSTWSVELHEENYRGIRVEDKCYVIDVFYMEDESGSEWVCDLTYDFSEDESSFSAKKAKKVGQLYHEIAKGIMAEALLKQELHPYG